MENVIVLEELSNEELILLAKNGDKKAYEFFFDKNIKLSYLIAHRWDKTPFCFDDIVQMCNLGLVKAYNTFDIGKKFKFSTYATSIMNNEILMSLRKHKAKYRLDVSLDTPVYQDRDGNDLTILDILEVPEDFFTPDKKMDFDNAVKQYFEKASNKEKEIFDLYKKGLSQRDVGKVLNISQSYVSRITSKIEFSIKEIIENGQFKQIPASGFTANNRPKTVNVEQLIYILQNYPELKSSEIAQIMNIKQVGTVSKHKSHFNKGRYVKKQPDSSIKTKVDEFIRAKSTFK